MMKNIVIISLLIFLIPSTYGFELNDTYTLMTIENCYDDVRVIDKDPFINDYEIINFTRIDNKWIHDCKNFPFDIIINSSAKQEREYNLEILYELDKIIETNTTSNDRPTKQDIINDNNKRFYNFEGLLATPVEQKKEPFKWPEMTSEETKQLLLLGSFGILLIILLCVIIYIVFIREKDNYIEDDDDDIDNFFRKHI